MSSHGRRRRRTPRCGGKLSLLQARAQNIILILKTSHDIAYCTHACSLSRSCECVYTSARTSPCFLRSRYTNTAVATMMIQNVWLYLKMEDGVGGKMVELFWSLVMEYVQVPLDACHTVQIFWQQTPSDAPAQHSPVYNPCATYILSSILNF